MKWPRGLVREGAACGFEIMVPDDVGAGSMSGVNCRPLEANARAAGQGLSGPGFWPGRGHGLPSRDVAVW